VGGSTTRSETCGRGIFLKGGRKKLEGGGGLLWGKGNSWEARQRNRGFCEYNGVLITMAGVSLDARRKVRKLGEGNFHAMS